MCFPEKQDEETRVWSHHQFILRMLGSPLSKKVKQKRKDAEIALHCDSHDFPTDQPLMFFPYGELDGAQCVDGTDLMVFEHAHGGKSCRIQTVVPNCVAIVLMNSCEQLHGGALVENPRKNGGFSLRYIPYFLRDIVKFTEARKQNNSGQGPRAFTNLRTLGISEKPLQREGLKTNQRVATFWGRRKKGCKRVLLTATIKRRGPRRGPRRGQPVIDLQWDCGSYSPNWRRAVYSIECMDQVDKFSWITGNK